MEKKNYIWDFFIAHSGPDKPAAEMLYKLLAPHCKVFLDSYCLLPGDDWDQKLILAQTKSLATVVLISTRTDKAYYQREEIAAAIGMARRSQESHRVIPIFLEEVNAESSVPYGLRLKHSLSYQSMGGVTAVAQALLKLLSYLKSTTWTDHTEQTQKVLKVRPFKMGEYMLQSAFLRGEFIPVANTDWYTNFTVPIPDAIVHMWQVCKMLNPNCQRYIKEKQILFSVFKRCSYTLEFKSSDFIVTTECIQARGSLFNPFRAETANTYDVNITVLAQQQLVEEIIAKFKSISPQIQVMDEIG